MNNWFTINKNLLVIIFLFSGVIIAGYRSVIVPLQEQLYRSKAQITKSQQNLQHSWGGLKQFSQVQNKIKLLSGSLPAAQQLITAEMLRHDLESIANSNHLSLKTSIVNTAVFQSLTTHAVNLELIGSYSQLVNFIEMLRHTNYAYDHLIIVPTANNALLMQATIVAYTLTQAPSDINAHSLLIFPRKNSYAHDPFNLVPMQLSLTAWDINALKFIGVIRAGRKIWAVISDPNGFVHHAIIGSVIGVNHSQIIQIDDHQIITSNRNETLYR